MVLGILDKILLKFGYRILSLSSVSRLRKNSKHKNYIFFDEIYIKQVNILKGAIKTIKKNIIKFIEVEISASNNYENDYNFEIIFKLMHENSFRLINLDKISYSREGKIIQFDLLFENQSLSNV